MLLFAIVSAHALTWVPDPGVEEPPGWPNDSVMDVTNYLNGSATYEWSFLDIPGNEQYHVLGKFVGTSAEMAGIQKQWMTIADDPGCVACATGYSGHPGLYATIGAATWTGNQGEYSRTVTLMVDPDEWPNEDIDDPEWGVMCLPIRPEGTIPEDPFFNCEFPMIEFSFGGIP